MYCPRALKEAEDSDFRRQHQRGGHRYRCKIRRAFLTEIPNTTKLIIAQRISSVQDADRIIVLDNGELNGFGTHEELLQANAIYRDVYESQTGGDGDFDEGGAA